MASAQKHLADKVGSRLRDPLVMGILHSWSQHVAKRAADQSSSLAFAGWLTFILAACALGLAGVGHAPTLPELLAGILGGVAGFGLGMVVAVWIVVRVVAAALRRQPVLK